MKNRLG